MAFNEMASRRLAQLACSVLCDPETPEEAKSLAGYVLSQIPDHLWPRNNALLNYACYERVARARAMPPSLSGYAEYMLKTVEPGALR
jgi:hypothetical protein